MSVAPVDIRAITSLAVLRVNWDEQGRDYLENFAPFLTETLRASHEDLVSLGAVTEQMTALVGFSLPQGVVKTLLRRAAARKHVRRQNGVFYIDRERLPSEPMAKKEGDLRRECEALVTKLQAFASERFGVSWSGMEAEHALFGVIETHAAPLLHAARRGERPVAPVLEHQAELYVAASFVGHVYESDPSAFAYLESVATGAVLASAVYHENPAVVVERFDHLVAYLDTPLVLEMLGVNGRQVQVPLVEMIELMQDQGVDVRMFRSTMHETQGVIDAYGSATGDRRHDVGRGPIRGALSPSDARVLSAQLEDRLSEIGVRVLDHPGYDRTYGVDEGALEDRLQGAIDYVNPGARLHDAQALMSVYALRRGGRPSRLEKAEAVFVTTNATLARAAHWFFHDEHGRETVRAPLCVTADDLATRLWLKTPNEAPELPARQLLARTYAALQPSDALLGKYLAETDRLLGLGTVSERDYLIMRSSDDLLRRVTEATLNDADAFTEGTIDEIRAREMASIEAAASARVERSEAARLEAERRTETLEAEKSALRESADRETTERAAQSASLAEARAERTRLSDSHAAQLAREDGRRDRVRRVAARVGRAVKVAAWLVLGALLGGGVLVALPSIPDAFQGIWRVFAGVAILATVAVAIASAFRDAGGWAARPGRWAESHTEKLLLSWMDLSGDESDATPHAGTDSPAGPELPRLAHPSPPDDLAAVRVTQHADHGAAEEVRHAD